MTVDGATTLEDHGVPRKRLPSLTSLRFFGAALVVGVHVGALFPTASSVAQHGQVGVSFFYLLSGFVLTWAPSTTDTAMRFYRRRIARIIPVHVLTWTIAVAFIPLVTNTQQDWLGNFLALPLLQAWIPTGSIAFAGNGVAWSLSVEVFFYALFPLITPLVWRLSGRKLWLLLGAMILAILLVAGLSPLNGLIYIFPISRLPEFVIGVCLAVLMQRGWRPPLNLTAAATLAALTTLVGYFPGVPDRYSFVAITVIPYALLISAACASDIDGGSFLSPKVLIRAGEWSFALFMTHQLVVKVYGWLVPSLSIRLYLLPLLLVFCVALAWATFRFIEQPLERRLRGQQGPLPA